jgi:hypothetical protein
VRKNVECKPRELRHRTDLLGRSDPARDDLIGRNHRIVRRIVFEKELDDVRHEQGSARQTGIALGKRSGRYSAGDDFQRNHIGAPDDHLVVIVVLAAVEVVRGQTAEIEESEDARRRLCGQSALAGNLVTPRTVARGDLIGLRDDELMRLPRVLVEHLRLAARDLDAFVHVVCTSV